MPNKKLYLPGEIELENAVQILAVLIDKLGGEVMIDRKHFEMMEDVEVKARQYGSTGLFLYLDEKDEHVHIEIRDPDCMPDPEKS